MPLPECSSHSIAQLSCDHVMCVRLYDPLNHLIVVGSLWPPSPKRVYTSQLQLILCVCVCESEREREREREKERVSEWVSEWVSERERERSHRNRHKWTRVREEDTDNTHKQTHASRHRGATQTHRFPPVSYGYNPATTLIPSGSINHLLHKKKLRDVPLSVPARTRLTVQSRRTSTAQLQFICVTISPKLVIFRGLHVCRRTTALESALTCYHVQRATVRRCIDERTNLKLPVYQMYIWMWHSAHSGEPHVQCAAWPGTGSVEPEKNGQ